MRTSVGKERRREKRSPSSLGWVCFPYTHDFYRINDILLVKRMKTKVMENTRDESENERSP